VTQGAPVDRPDAPLVVRSTAVAPATLAPLVDLLPPVEAVAWLRRGEGLVGWGTAASVRTTGPARFTDADAWWAGTTARAVVRDDVDEPGSGLVCFGSMAFSDAPDDDPRGESVLVVPSVVVGRRGDVAWVTTISSAGLAPTPAVPGPTDPPTAPAGVRFADGHLSPDAWAAVVAEGVRRIQAGDLEKVVLARDLVATADEPVDVRWPLARLAEGYPTCWTFHVDGFFGATPELLVRRERGLVTSRVLAGTIRRTGDDARDLMLAATLARSSKDLEEHEYAVRSVGTALEPHCSSMNLPEAPFVLHLPNVMHLATDVTGVVAGSPDGAGTVSSLALAASLHPSAAVGGHPTEAAVALIAEIEGMPRHRYAGPVGWMDASGDGEWGIGLRSAEVSGATVRLFAGCGVVGDSDPDSELAESNAKLVPVRDALGG
jgi:menaquinone-specific isochorismate synthase